MQLKLVINMDIFDQYNFINLKPKNYLFIIIVVIIIFTLWFLNQNTIEAYNTKAIIIYENQEYYLLLNIPVNDVKKVINNNKLIIENVTSTYCVENIRAELVVINDINYQQIILKTQLKEKNKIPNLVINLKIKNKEIKLLNKIINILRERE